jgi:hypothetical protein
MVHLPERHIPVHGGQADNLATWIKFRLRGAPAAHSTVVVFPM